MAIKRVLDLDSINNIELHDLIEWTQKTGDTYISHNITYQTLVNDITNRLYELFSTNAQNSIVKNSSTVSVIPLGTIFYMSYNITETKDNNKTTSNFLMCNGDIIKSSEESTEDDILDPKCHILESNVYNRLRDIAIDNGNEYLLARFNNYLRLPDYNGLYIRNIDNVSDNHSKMDCKLPNISGTAHVLADCSCSSGALGKTSAWTMNCHKTSGSITTYTLDINASKSSDIYSNKCKEVIPNSILMVPYILINNVSSGNGSVISDISFSELFGKNA